MLDLKSLNPFQHKSRPVAKQPETPVDPFRGFRQEMDHLFDNFFNGSGVGPVASSWDSSIPKLEVTDGEKDLLIAAELPGLKKRTLM